MEKLDDNFLLAHIISYIGRNHYRFVAAINQRFHTVYDDLFPGDKFTEINVSTMEHAIICVNEVNRRNWHPNRKTKVMHRGSFCSSAVRQGNLLVLQYLRSVRTLIFRNGCPWDNETCRMAASYGHLCILQYAHDHGCSWNDEVCYDAAMKGHLHILRYAHENGCPWHRHTCAVAAYNNHLHIIKYAHEHGCPWDVVTCTAAALRGYVHILQYLHEHGCPWDEDRICDDAARRGHLNTAQYAHEHGCTWNNKPMPVDEESNE